MTFVDWDDLHKWRLIDKGLEMGVGDPVETYSSSPHLYADLDIPAGTKGRLPGSHSPAVRDSGRPAADRPRSAGDRPRRDDGPRREGQGRADLPAREPRTPAAEAGADGAPHKRRRRRRGGTGAAQTAPSAD